MIDGVDAESLTWSRLRKHLTTRIETLRDLNEADLDEIDTAKTRGGIAELRLLISDVERASRATPEIPPS